MSKGAERSEISRFAGTCLASASPENAIRLTMRVRMTDWSMVDRIESSVLRSEVIVRYQIGVLLAGRKLPNEAKR